MRTFSAWILRYLGWWSRRPIEAVLMAWRAWSWGRSNFGEDGAWVAGKAWSKAADFNGKASLSVG